MVVQLKVKKRRFKCYDCEKDNTKWNTFIENFSFIDKNSSYSNIFKVFILREWEFNSISELSRKFKVSQKKVYSVINNITIEELEKEKIKYMISCKEIIIWIDEFSFSWRNYLVQINDIKTKKVLAILQSKDNKLLEKWLDKLPIIIINKISWIWSDMNAWFKNIIQKHIAKRTNKTLKEVKQFVKSSVDHYHLKQLVNKLILEVYALSNWMIKAWHYDKNIKDLLNIETLNFNKYRTKKLEKNVDNFHEYNPNNPEYKAITLWFYLSKKYNVLFLMKEENLTEKQCLRLNQILAEFDPKWYLSEAYLGKELLYEAIELKDITLVEKLILDFQSSINYKINTCWKTLLKWKDEIQNFFTTWITNAFTEWKNTKAKLLKRMAYWYKSKENYIKRLLICL